MDYASNRDSNDLSGPFVLPIHPITMVDSFVDETNPGRLGW